MAVSLPHFRLITESDRPIDAPPPSADTVPLPLSIPDANPSSSDEQESNAMENANATNNNLLIDCGNIPVESILHSITMKIKGYKILNDYPKAPNQRS